MGGTSAAPGERLHSFIHSEIFISGVAAGYGNNIKSSFITQKNMFSRQIDVFDNLNI